MYRKLALLLAGLSLAGAAQANSIATGQWYTFGFGINGSTLTNGSGYILGTNPDAPAAPNSPWTFTLDAAGGSLLVTDGFIFGDQFELFDFGVSIGTTSDYGQSGNCMNNVTACLADPSISKGTFSLGQGAHSITGSVFSSINNGGAGFFIVRGLSPAVPEPASWAMMIGGLAMVGGFMRRRKPVVTFA